MMRKDRIEECDHCDYIFLTSIPSVTRNTPLFSSYIRPERVHSIGTSKKVLYRDQNATQQSNRAVSPP